MIFLTKKKQIELCEKLIHAEKLITDMSQSIPYDADTTQTLGHNLKLIDTWSGATSDLTKVFAVLSPNIGIGNLENRFINAISMDGKFNDHKRSN